MCQSQRRKQRRYIPPAPRARCPQRRSTWGTPDSVTVRGFALVAAFLLAAFLRSYLLPQELGCKKVHVLVVPDDAVTHDPRFHNMTAVAHALAHHGITVTLGKSSQFQGDLDRWKPQLGKFDVVLLQGQMATALADYAASVNTTVVRFVGVRELGVNDPISPLLELPEVIVMGSNSRAKIPKEHGFWDVPHLELPVGSVPDYNAPQYKDLLRLIWPLCKDAKRMIGKLEKRAEVTKDIMGLVIIAKNEGLRISDPLLSMKDHIDYWTVLDSNSTDNTTTVVENLMAGKPGQLLRTEFINFSTARNLALRSHGQRTKYAVMLDADMSIPAAWRLRLTLQRIAQLCARDGAAALCHQAIKMRAFLEDVKFFTIRVFPTAHIGTQDGWHYIYPVHEIPQNLKLPPTVNGEATSKLMTVDIITAADPIMRHVARARNLDLRLLREERVKRPDDARVAFYLAQTLHTLEMLPEAVQAYQDRIEMGGWYEEVFESLLRKGKILMTMEGGDPVPDLLRAAETSPYRAEPYMVMAWHYGKRLAECVEDNIISNGGWKDTGCELRNRVAAYHYAKRASQMPKPQKDLMFVDLSTYDVHALRAVVDHGFQVAWKTRGAARIGKASAEFLSSFRSSTQPYDPSRAEQLRVKYEHLATTIASDNTMWGKGPD